MFEIIMQVLAGLGIAFIGDKVMPAPAPPTPDLRTGISNLPILKIVALALFLALGSFIAIFVGRKLRIFRTRR